MPLTSSVRTTAALAAVLLAGTGLAACTATDDADADAGIQIAAAFYPLEFVAGRVAGEHGSVTALAPPGVEPHDLELAPLAVRELGDADVVLYLSAFQPAIDDAVAATGARALDAATVIDLRESATSGLDPHFWLDPSLLADYAGAVAEEFAALDPENADYYRANGAALVEELTALDAQFTAGLASCERTTIFVAHEAFAYLTSRYGLTEQGLSGLDPESEPSPARVREIRDLIAAAGATTIFTESLVTPTVTEALASDAGVQTAVLDPLESVAPGDDYLAVMQRNLTALEDALACS